MRAVLAAAMLCLAAMPACAEIASCYGRENGQMRTATGAAYNTWRPTAAHRALPFGTRVLVLNTKNWRSVVVTINDRGPYHRKYRGGPYDREFDLSLGACRAIGLSLGPIAARVVGQ